MTVAARQEFQRRSSGGANPATPAPTGRWYFVVAILSVGILAWWPFVHAAHRVGSATARRLAWIYGMAAVVVLALAGATPQDAAGNPIGTAGTVLQTMDISLALVVIIGACIQLTPLRRQAYHQPGQAESLAAPQAGDGHPDATDRAVAEVLAARTRRAQARALAARDPLMARELRIGHPDQPSAYDDGGLVDLNTTSASTIAAACDIDLANAQRIVAARERQGGTFSNVDEVFVVTELPVPLWDRIRDKAVVIG